VSFVYRGKAWLLCGPSGVGKTTQYRNWMKRFPGEIEIICGDMPALEAREDGSVWVHPSPWNGKERFGAPDGSAELMGIVRLVQAKANEFEPLAPAEAVVPLLRQFAVRPETAGQIRLLAAIAEKVLSSAPAMLYRNRGDLESTEILRSKFDELLERK
ncbi:MAG: hypothetical protein II756_01870, partial [Clostridia bacterium]|nr:hypothetical protein [Clostridia bacterium]